MNIFKERIKHMINKMYYKNYVSAAYEQRGNIIKISGTWNMDFWELMKQCYDNGKLNIIYIWN